MSVFISPMADSSDGGGGGGGAGGRLKGTDWATTCACSREVDLFACDNELSSSASSKTGAPLSTETGVVKDGFEIRTPSTHSNYGQARR